MIHGIKPINQSHAEWIQRANAEGLIDWVLVAAILQDFDKGIYSPDDEKWNSYEYQVFLDANAVLGLA